MTEKNEKPPAPRVETPPPPGPASVLIPVAELRFRPGIMVDVPGKNAATGLRASGPVTGGYWRIAFDPRIRHHRIEFYPPSAGQRVPVVAYVPESWCAWSPL